MNRILFATLPLLACAAIAQGHAGHAPVAQAAPETPAAQYVRVDVYPLSTCVVSGKQLGANAVAFEAAGRTFRVCSDDCRATVEKDATAFAKKLDDAIVAQQLANYPLETCPMTGKSLGSMGNAAQIVIDNTLVQLCCRGCAKKATARAAAVVELIHDEAFAQQLQGYALDACVVSGASLAKGEPVNVMLGTTLVRVASKQCVEELAANAAKYLAKVPARPRAKAAPAAGAAKGGCCGGGEDAPAANEAAKPVKTDKAEGGCGGCSGEGEAEGHCGEGDKAKAPPAKDSKAKGGECCGDGANAKPAGDAKGAKKDGECCGDGAADAKPAGDAKAKKGGCCGGDDDAKAKPAGDAKTKDGGCCGDSEKPQAKPEAKPAPKQAH